MIITLHWWFLPMGLFLAGVGFLLFGEQHGWMPSGPILALLFWLLALASLITGAIA